MTVPSIDEYCFKVAIGIPADNQVLLKGMKEVLQIAP
jgi:histidinol-phosphate aminotransferase